ncbi:hypothetical protein GCM10027586_13660 [Kineococcus gypseus]
MPSFERAPARALPPSTRASRWADRRTAELFTTRTLRENEARLRSAASRGEPWLELRAPAPASAGRLLVREGEDVLERPVTCAVVRLDLSAGALVVLSAAPEDLPTCDDAWDLLQVLSTCAEDAVEHWWDPRVAVDTVLAADPSRAAAALAQWRVELHRSAGPAEVVRRVTGGSGPPPEGVDWAAWAGWFEQLPARHGAGGTGADAPTGVPVVREEPSLRRTGRFDDDVPVRALIEEVLTARRAEVEEWWRRVAGSRRLRVLADLGRVVGTVDLPGPVGGVAATHVAVVLHREPGGPVVLDAHPEVPAPADADVPPALRLLGAYLGPGLSHVDAQPWCAQRRLLQDEPTPVVERLCAALEDVARREATQLHAVLEAAGAAAVPGDAHGWVERLLWRRRTFPWTGEG